VGNVASSESAEQAREKQQQDAPDPAEQTLQIAEAFIIRSSEQFVGL